LPYERLALPLPEMLLANSHNRCRTKAYTAPLASETTLKTRYNALGRLGMATEQDESRKCWTAKRRTALGRPALGRFVVSRCHYVHLQQLFYCLKGGLTC